MDNVRTVYSSWLQYQIHWSDQIHFKMIIHAEFVARYK